MAQKADFKINQVFADVDHILRTPGAIVPPPFEASDANLKTLFEETRVLVVGAGGLGSEILKDLALSGFKTIEIIDLDTIELSNLNRQFLFRKKDIKRHKAEVAAEFVKKRCPQVDIKFHTEPIQNFPKKFFSSFHIIIAGLDNIEARQWLNSVLVSLLEHDNDGNVDVSTVIPFIDGGTEGFRGQARVFLPGLSACFECSMGAVVHKPKVEICTIANKPRIPEHCIQYAYEILWPLLSEFKDHKTFKLLAKDVPDNQKGKVKLDKDDAEHMTWLFEQATARAKEYNIEGVTYSLTMQVVKNIIPAVASTNALISAICVNEALKFRTWCSYNLNNYYMYMGKVGTYSRTFEFERNPECPVCSGKPIKLSLDKTNTLGNFLKKLELDPAIMAKKITLTNAAGKPLYLHANAQAFEADLARPIGDLFGNEEELVLTTVNLALPRRIRVKFEDGEFFYPPEEKA